MVSTGASTIQPPVPIESRPAGGSAVSGAPNMVGNQATMVGSIDREQIYTWIQELTHPETREQALLELR